MPTLPSDAFLKLLSPAFRKLTEGFQDLPPITTHLDPRANPVLDDLARRLHDNYPYFHPLYAGQMLKPPHPIAQAAYALAMSINPNNHARDGGRASSEMELEAVCQIAGLFGWAPSNQPAQNRNSLAHNTSSGTP